MLLSIPAVLMIYLSAGGGLQLLSLGGGLWCTEVFVFLGVPWLLARTREEDPIAAARAHWPGWPALGLGFLVGAVNYFALVVPVQVASQAVFPESWVEFFHAGHLFSRQSTLDLVLILTAVCI